MFVCIELGTDDATIWADVEEKLSRQLGLTHIIWGINKGENNAPVACELPSNMFYVKSTTVMRELHGMISRVVTSCGCYTYNILVSSSDGWFHDSKSKLTPTSIEENACLEVCRET